MKLLLKHKISKPIDSFGKECWLSVKNELKGDENTYIEIVDNRLIRYCDYEEYEKDEFEIISVEEDKFDKLKFFKNNLINIL